MSHPVNMKEVELDSTSFIPPTMDITLSHAIYLMPPKISQLTRREPHGDILEICWCYCLF